MRHLSVNTCNQGLKTPQDLSHVSSLPFQAAHPSLQPKISGTAASQHHRSEDAVVIRPSASRLRTRALELVVGFSHDDGALLLATSVNKVRAASNSLVQEASDAFNPLP